MNDWARFLTLVFVLSVPIFSAFLASEKNRNPAYWFFLGLVFNIVGLIAIAGLPVLDLEEERAYDERMKRQDELEREALERAQSSGTTPWDPRTGAPPN